MLPSAEQERLVGTVLDARYEILEPIGDGGVGVVYRARRLQLERIVAVKVLHDSLVKNEGFVRRFQREAVAMSRLHHPHCLSVIDFGVHESRPYLVLEYVPGQTVKTLLQHEPFPPARAVSIALQLLDTLDYFHRHHVIHRDLKSENVMLVESSGAEDFIKVLDFGMAKILVGPGADSQLSQLGFIPGTPSAMAPEQIRQIPPDPRIDIYATGILLYEMIVGQRPFTDPDMATVIKMQMSMPPKPPREALGEDVISNALEQVILKALQKDRVDRFATAGDMAAALRETPEGRTASAPPATGTEAAPPRSRRRTLAFGGAALVVGGTLAALLWPRASLPRSPEPTPAPQIVRATQPAPAPSPAPPEIVETWLAHRGLAVTYLSRNQHDDAFREVQSAVTDDREAATADAALVDVAVATLTPDRLEFVTQTFRDHPHLVEALARETATGRSAARRHTAREALHALGQDALADVTAMRILDLEQATSCKEMRTIAKGLRASKDGRASAFFDQLRSRGRRDPSVKCLGPLLARARSRR